ncbi:MAG: hypothetical protein LBE36_12480 [Flavobacteriaceae bacterium]|nr:hypothetical protein [Flavobacteriaceae bacterium]
MFWLSGFASLLFLLFSMESANPSDLREGWKWKSFFLRLGFLRGRKKDCNGQPDPSGCNALARDTPKK